jgi:hypothetical protein
MTRLARIAAAAALACAGCAGAQKAGQAPPRVNRWGKPWKEGIVVPPWVDKLPESGGGRLVAVGYSQPSFWPQDAINAAAEDARGKLALALSSHVEVLGIDTATESSTGGATINKEATDVVMRNSRIEAVWTDENGERSDPGGVWALASLEMGTVRAQAAAAGAKSGPAWLDRLPAAEGKAYALGYSGPTYHSEDAARYAGEDAIANLAQSLRAHVQAYTLLVESASGLTVDQFAQTLDDPDEAFRQLVRKNARVEATWVDRDGVRPGDPPGAVWALASIEVRDTKGAVRPVENQDLGPALDPSGK